MPAATVSAICLVGCAQPIPEEPEREPYEETPDHLAIPGLLPQHCAPYDACKRQRFALSAALMVNGSAYCSGRCATFSEQYVAQHGKLAALDEKWDVRGGEILYLYPGKWEHSVADTCSRCLLALDDDNYAYELPDDDVSEAVGFCGLCAVVVAQQLAVHHTWFKKLSVDSWFTSLPPAPAAQWGIPLTIPDYMPPPNSDPVTSDECELKKARCLGLPWTGRTGAYRVEAEYGISKDACVFCADDYQAEQQQLIWNESHCASLLLNVCGMVPDLVPMIAAYVLGGRFLHQPSIRVLEDWEETDELIN